MSAADKIFPPETLSETLDGVRRSGRTIALANGLFDILHVGHLRYLEAASAEADLLLVGINSDSSAQELKGPDRPVIPEHTRRLLRQSHIIPCTTRSMCRNQYVQPP